MRDGGSKVHVAVRLSVLATVYDVKDETEAAECVRREVAATQSRWAGGKLCVLDAVNLVTPLAPPAPSTPTARAASPAREGGADA